MAGESASHSGPPAWPEAIIGGRAIPLASIGLERSARPGWAAGGPGAGPMQGEQVAEAGGLTTADWSRSLQSPVELPGGSRGAMATGLAPYVGVGRGRHQTQARVRPETLGPGRGGRPVLRQGGCPHCPARQRVALAGLPSVPPTCGVAGCHVRNLPLGFWYRLGSRLVSSFLFLGQGSCRAPEERSRGPISGAGPSGELSGLPALESPHPA